MTRGGAAGAAWVFRGDGTRSILHRSVIETRCAESSCITTCQKALEAGTTKFEKVYSVVWDYVSDADATAWAEYPSAVAALRGAIPADAKPKPTQRCDDACDLYRDAALCKPIFQKAVANIASAAPESEVRAAPKLKGLARILEKVAFEGSGASTVRSPRGYFSDKSRPRRGRDVDIPPRRCADTSL